MSESLPGNATKPRPSLIERATHRLSKRLRALTGSTTKVNDRSTKNQTINPQESFETAQHLLEQIDRYFNELSRESPYRGFNREGLYRVPGASVAVSKAYNEYADGQKDLPEDADEEILASLMKKVLQNLREPIIPYTIQKAMISAANLKDLELREIIESMPKPNHDLLIDLVTHMDRILAHDSQNKMTEQALAVVFGPAVFKCNNMLDAPRANQSLQNLLERRLVLGLVLNASQSPVTSIGESPSTDAPNVEKVEEIDNEGVDENASVSSEKSSSSVPVEATSDKQTKSTVMIGVPLMGLSNLSISNKVIRPIPQNPSFSRVPPARVGERSTDNEILASTSTTAVLEGPRPMPRRDVLDSSSASKEDETSPFDSTENSSSSDTYTLAQEFGSSNSSEQLPNNVSEMKESASEASESISETPDAALESQRIPSPRTPAISEIAVSQSSTSPTEHKRSLPQKMKSFPRQDTKFSATSTTYSLFRELPGLSDRSILRPTNYMIASDSSGSASHKSTSSAGSGSSRRTNSNPNKMGGKSGTTTADAVKLQKSRSTDEDEESKEMLLEESTEVDHETKDPVKVSLEPLQGGVESPFSSGPINNDP